MTVHAARLHAQLLSGPPATSAHAVVTRDLLGAHECSERAEVCVLDP